MRAFVTRDVTIDVSIASGAWLVFVYALFARAQGERIRDGVYAQNIFPGFAWSVAALALSVVGRIVARGRWARWSLLLVAILSTMLVLTHRLVLG
jgi:hypothetical protein